MMLPLEASPCLLTWSLKNYVEVSLHRQKCFRKVRKNSMGDRVDSGAGPSGSAGLPSLEAPTLFTTPSAAW